MFFLVLAFEAPLSLVMQVGDVFLKNVVFATDVGKNQVALAKQV